MNLVTLLLTCADEKEALLISNCLLDKKLAACIRQTQVSSDFIWKGEKEHSEEVMLIIESVAERFKDIEDEVRKHHSYETFVLSAYPVSMASAGVNEWVEESMKKTNNNPLSEAVLFTDGGSRGNPGPSAIAFVICKLDKTVVEKSGKYIGETTNNQAEYQALRSGLIRAQELGVAKLTVNMDSELVIKQVTGLYKIKNQDLLPQYTKIKELEELFDKITFQHVPRAMNAEADKQVNKILDEYKNKSV